MYVELTLVNGKNTPACFTVGSFWFTMHPEGGSNVYLNGAGCVHVNEGYEWIIAALKELSVPISRTPEDDWDDGVIEGTPEDL